MSAPNVVPISRPPQPVPRRAIDRPITVTRFPDRYARSKREIVIRFRRLPEAMGKRWAPTKERLPWLKLATFGEEPSAKGGCYRTNANMVAIDGIEGDHDAGTMGVDEASGLLRAAGIAAIVYTSASHTPDNPRWRVLCPTSATLPPDARKALVARLNGALRGTLASESFTDSQAYYYGLVGEARHYRCEIVDGRAIDEACELDAGALGKRGEPYQQEERAADYDPLLDGELRPEPDYGLIKLALTAIPPSERAEREFWLLIGAAVHGATGGSEEGFQIWDEWSFEGDGVYDEPHGDHRRVWNSFGNHHKPAGIGTIIFHAKKFGFKPRPRSTSRLEFLNPEDCAAAPPRGYKIKGLVAPGDVACLFGPPGSGKSALAPRLGYHVALGEPVFGLRTRKGGVFYIAAEDRTGMANRIAALRRRLGDAPEFLLVAGLSDLLAENSADRVALLDAIGERGLSMIFIDTMSMAFPGLDENDPEEMGRAVQFARTLAERGPAVVLVHHGTKADGSTPRGHSVFNGALDMAMRIEPGVDGIVRARLTKNRNGPCDIDIAFRIGSEELGIDEDGDAITAAIAEPLESIAAPKVKLSRAARKAMEIFVQMRDATGSNVCYDDWRKRCVDSSLLCASNNLKSHGRAFERARLDLQNAKMIVVENGTVFEHHGFGDT